MKEGKVLSGYILSIVALVFSFVSPIAGLVLGIVGLSQTNKEKSAMAKKGKIMSIIAICISIIFLVITLLIALGIIGLPNVPTY
ncbi:DUF4190 domain-containing protein [Candidatus Pacearchaeota archaeon]|nr:DUF4190 domain-containing protein [Candidatus Pacearchaeota archaeon]